MDAETIRSAAISGASRESALLVRDDGGLGLLAVLLLALATYMAAAYCLSFPNEGRTTPGIWLVNGIALAALLRTSRRRWPSIIVAAFLGNFAADVQFQDKAMLLHALSAATNVVQFVLCAAIVRGRVGRYFDLTDIRHLLWLAGMGAATTAIKVGVAMGLNVGLGIADIYNRFMLDWSLIVFLGLFVLALPLLALSAPRDRLSKPMDLIGITLVLLQFSILFLTFGPPGYPGVYLAVPVLMLLAWRHGLFGAGLGSLVTVVAACMLLRFTSGLDGKLSIAGYNPTERGTYLELFFSVAILMCLPLAIGRTRQLRMEKALADALHAANRRSAMLAKSEAAARRSESALVENELRWRSAIEGSGLGVWDWNLSRREIYLSQRLNAMFGYPGEERQNSLRSIRARIHPEDRQRNRVALQRYLRGETETYECQMRCRCADGSYRWFHDRGMIFERDADGLPVRMIGTYTDIHNQKVYELRSRRHARLYATLAACNAAIARRAPIDDLSATICDILVGSSDIKLAWIGFANEETGLFGPLTIRGEALDHVSHVRLSARADDPRGLGPTGTAFRQDKAVWVDDFAKDTLTASWREAGARFGWKGMAAIPLRRKNEKVAIMGLHAGDIDFFDDEVRALLMDIAAQFSLALEIDEVEDAAARYQANLTESERRFRAVFEASPIGIAVMDTAKGDFHTVNPRFEAIVGRTLDELRALTWQAITHPEDLAQDVALWDRFARGAIDGYQLEKRYLRKTGETVWVHMTIARFALPGEPVAQHLCMIEDITEEKSLRSQMEFAQRMESIGQLTGGVAHDFNNLLTIMIGSSESLLETLQDEEQRKLAALVLRAAEQGGELTRRLLAFSRRQPLEPQSFDLNMLLDRNIPLLRRSLGGGLRFVVDASAELRRVFADPGQTEAAILNLCINARDAMPEGGVLTLATRNASFDEDSYRHHPDASRGDYVVIEVSDTGTGIAPELMSRIFEPFFTTKEAGQGSGLGLSMVYGFVRQSGGFVEVRSDLGRGTCFALHLPTAPVGDGNDDDASEGTDEAPPIGDERILLVEDNEVLRAHAVAQLQGLGYQVIDAEDGPAALAILGVRQDIDLLFTDIVMPGGLNGRELAERATADQPWLRVLYTSGYSRDALMKDGRLVAGVTLLQKPYSKLELARKIRKVLDEIPPL
jgi:PAS domain S-box-containing protein